MTFDPADAYVPTLQPGEHAYTVKERPGVIVAGKAGAWCAGRISPKRTGFAGPFGYGRTREQAVAALR